MLLASTDLPPVRIDNPGGASPFLLIGDHAGNRVPSRLGQLRLPAAELTRHIAWDIGIAALGGRLSVAMDAVFIHQIYSRLVIDCNRDPRAPDAIPPCSDGTAVPGNAGLTPADRAARIAAIHAPYQDAVAAEIARRDKAGCPPTLISLHSFTPRMSGHDRPWHIGVLYSGGDTRFARALLHELRDGGALCVGDNAPYAMDATDHTVPRHAFAQRLRYAEIEIRQDLLARPEQVAQWSQLLGSACRRAAEQIVD